MNDSDKQAKMDAVFARWNRPGSPGCAVAVYGPEGVLFEKGYGSACLEHDAPITADTVFHVASVSKQFTVLALLLLEREGLVDLDEDVRRWFPEFPDLGHPVTLRHIARHTAGLRDQWMLLVLAGYRMEDVIDDDDALGVILRQQALNFPPGRGFSYSNSGYTLMALLVERVAGAPLAAFLEERVFAPLGMDRTLVRHDYRRVVPGLAFSYAPLPEGGFQRSILSYRTAGPTGVNTTIRDLAAWERNWFAPTVGDRAMLDAMAEPGVLADGAHVPYGLGLAVRRYRGLAVVEHGGADAGYRSHLMRFPEQRRAVAVLGNLSTLDTWSLAHRVADLWLADAMDRAEGLDVADLLEGYRPGEQELTGQAGVYRSPSRGRTLIVEKTADGLEVRKTPPVRLAPLGKDRYRLGKDGLAELSFSRGADGRVQGAAHAVGRAPSAAFARIEAWRPSSVDLAPFAGVYYSEELDASWGVAAREEGLVLRMRRHGDFPLTPTGRDGFVLAFDPYTDFPAVVDVTFTRDDGGRVHGLLVSTERNWNVPFARIV